VRSADLRRAAIRLRATGCVLALGLAVLAARATHLAVLDERGASRGASQTRSTWSIPAPRGLIVDRQGAELAITVRAPSVYAIPPLVTDPAEAARLLAGVLGRNHDSLAAGLTRKSQFAYLARWVDEKTASEVEALELPGVAILREPKRAYPHRELAAHVLGFANIDGDGVRGIEQLEEVWLRGSAQAAQVQRDARRRALALGALDLRSAQGGDISLTLDATLQAEAEEGLAAGVQNARAKGGLVVTLDPHTGDLLALAEWPRFDPNQFRSIPYETTRSRAFLDAVEPGSTLKPFVVAAALERGVLGTHELIDTGLSGTWRVPGKTLRDFKPYGVLDPTGIIRVSSNIGAAMIGYRVGPQAQWEQLRRFGFGRVTGTGFPEESAGLLRSWKHWEPVDHATISFGQGINVTAVQLASAAGAIAADGIWHAPRLVDARRAPGGDWEPAPREPGRRALRPEVARTVLGMMGSVVGPGGTGRRAGLSGVPVAGKTGTAQKLDPATGGYSSSNYMAWFVGIVPADDPRLVVVVMIDEPRGVHGGGAVAAPVFAQVAANQLARYDIWTEPQVAPAVAPVLRADGGEPEPEPAIRRPEPGPELQITRLGGRLLVPDFAGRSLAEVLAAAQQGELRVETSGLGRAVSQEPAAGSILAGGASVRVLFEPRSGGGEG
jgi:cell division protein FtsI (penicillin-binding protein 3)